jgi:hypothetical protein
MSLLGRISKSISHVVGNMGGLPKGATSQIGGITGNLLSHGNEITNTVQLGEVIGKLITQKTTGLSQLQKQSMAVLVHASLAHHIKNKGGKAPANLQKLLAQQKHEMELISQIIKQMHSTNHSIINNIK